MLSSVLVLLLYFFLFFMPPPSSEIYTLSLHDALPISRRGRPQRRTARRHLDPDGPAPQQRDQDRKSTRLNSSHRCISYAVFCLKKKKGARNTAGVCTRRLSTF